MNFSKGRALDFFSDLKGIYLFASFNFVENLSPLCMLSILVAIVLYREVPLMG